MTGRVLELLEATGILVPLIEDCRVCEDFVDEFSNDELRRFWP